MSALIAVSGVLAKGASICPISRMVTLARTGA